MTLQFDIGVFVALSRARGVALMCRNRSLQTALYYDTLTDCRESSIK